jgi:hypothetical protein
MMAAGFGSEFLVTTAKLGTLRKNPRCSLEHRSVPRLKKPEPKLAHIARAAMHIVTLPKKHRAEQYAAVRRTFEDTIQEFGVKGETAQKWLDGTMDMLRALVLEIETGGGAGGGRA